MGARRRWALPDPIHCLSKFNRILHASAQGAKFHHSHVGERVGERGGGGENKRISERASERASEREKRRARDREEERKRDPPRRAGEVGRKKERESYRARCSTCSIQNAGSHSEYLGGAHHLEALTKPDREVVALKEWCRSWRKCS